MWRRPSWARRSRCAPSTGNAWCSRCRPVPSTARSSASPGKGSSETAGAAISTWRSTSRSPRSSRLSRKQRSASLPRRAELSTSSQLLHHYHRRLRAGRGELRRLQHRRLHLCACDRREAELREELPGGLSEQVHCAYAAAPGEIEGGHRECRAQALAAALRRHGDRAEQRRYAVQLEGRTPHDARMIARHERDRKSTRLNSSHSQISYAVFCL